MIEFSLHKLLQSPDGEMNLNVDLTLEEGSLMTIYGKSGAGKSTLLMLLAGLLAPDKGMIRYTDKIWLDTEKRISLPPQKREIGFVFQEYALFPNMTVEENLRYGLRKGQSENIVNKLVEIVDLGQLRKRKTTALSGGQKQRVALARALVSSPKLLLLDEPLSALDHEMRSRLQSYILELHKEFNLTTILISHDVSEIIRLSDFMVHLDKGKVINKGVPADLFTSDRVNAKFQFTGEVIHMVQQDFIVIVTVLIGKDLVKVIANDREAANLSIGDKVLIASKAFNPIIHKVS
ncbi:ATP-binding cassette domain-containing protein [Lutimonas zeaxanthinifaciens]|uniref:ATP-binding cassette domain-containing protein n=1 Tax=Lutimonas zeaxanthinifaciens TaxID=3060215 RepID=UPI00265CB39B|nr:ATP-binding cassette domain-containing protein [Lutimonas sp. YSD2104]WKK65307.1 ATP-binding cassette domain-containing protein [Lutimonas sp. YSD2104]